MKIGPDYLIPEGKTIFRDGGKYPARLMLSNKLAFLFALLEHVERQTGRSDYESKSFVEMVRSVDEATCKRIWRDSVVSERANKMAADASYMKALASDFPDWAA